MIKHLPGCLRIIHIELPYTFICGNYEIPIWNPQSVSSSFSGTRDTVKFGEGPYRFSFERRHQVRPTMSRNISRSGAGVQLGWRLVTLLVVFPFLKSHRVCPLCVRTTFILLEYAEASGLWTEDLWGHLEKGVQCLQFLLSGFSQWHLTNIYTFMLYMYLHVYSYVYAY